MSPRKPSQPSRASPAERARAEPSRAKPSRAERRAQTLNKDAPQFWGSGCRVSGPSRAENHSAEVCGSLRVAADLCGSLRIFRRDLLGFGYVLQYVFVLIFLGRSADLCGTLRIFADLRALCGSFWGFGLRFANFPLGFARHFLRPRLKRFFWSADLCGSLRKVPP